MTDKELAKALKTRMKRCPCEGKYSCSECSHDECRMGILNDITGHMDCSVATVIRGLSREEDRPINTLPEHYEAMMTHFMRKE